MNKEITIYELLGLIKDGKAPKNIEYQGNYLEFDGEDYKYYKGAETLSEDSLVKYIAVGNLNDTVEILEEDKPIIEKLDVALLSQSDNWLWCPSKDEFSKDIELNSYIIQNIRENTLYFQRKINEIIDYINRKEDK